MYDKTRSIAFKIHQKLLRMAFFFLYFSRKLEKGARKITMTTRVNKSYTL